MKFLYVLLVFVPIAIVARILGGNMTSTLLAARRILTFEEGRERVRPRT